MKNRTSLTVMAAAATSLALVFGGVAPASAAGPKVGGSISCPANMHARISFTTTYEGSFTLYSKGYGVKYANFTWKQTSKPVYRTYSSPRNGAVSWMLLATGSDNFYATCTL